MEWSEFYNKVKEQVEKQLIKNEISEGALQLDKIMGQIMKEQLKQDGVFKTKIIGRDLKRQEYGKMVAYRDDSKIKITEVQK
jgi:hypothetical protein